MAALSSNGWMNCIRWMETLFLMDRNNSSVGRIYCFWWMETFLPLCGIIARVCCNSIFPCFVWNQ